MLRTRVRGARLSVLTLLLGAILIAMLSASSAAAAGPALPIPETLWKPAAGSVPASGNYVYLVSDPNEFVGLGRTYLYTQADATIKVLGSGGHLDIEVEGNEHWYSAFSTGQSPLQPGYYPVTTSDHPPWLDWYGEGRGVGSPVGWFAVDNVEFTDGALTALDLRFEQGTPGTPTLHGAIHWRADDPTQPPGPVLPVPDSLWQPAPGSTPDTINYIYMKSDPDDSVGGGRTYLCTQADSIIKVWTKGNLLSLDIDGDVSWHGEFKAMKSLTSVQAGYYPGLQRYPFHYNPVTGGLNVGGPNYGSNQLTGWFAVDHITYADGVLTSIDFRFEQHGDGKTPALHGAIHWRADDPTHPPGPVLPVPDTLWKPPADVAPDSDTYIYLDSDTGDYIGQGEKYLYTEPEDNISVAQNGGYLSVQAGGWSGDFQAMIGLTSLQAGYYPNLKRYPFENPARGGLDWSGNGRGSNILTGWFAVDDIEYVGGELRSIDLRFEQHSEGKTPALHGVIHWRKSPTGGVTGTVTGPDDSRLEGIDVTAFRRDAQGDWAYVDDTSTDQEGSYAFGGLYGGHYRIGFADYSGEYLEQWYGGATTMESATDVVVAHGATTSGIDATLRPAGHLTGTVRDAGGAGLEDIDVIAWRADGSGGWLPVNGTGTTAGGTYDLGGLDTGTYRIKFYDWTGDHIGQWYDGQTGPAAAKDVVVTAGETTSGTDAVLAVASHITGTVRASGGAGLEDIDVTAYLPDGSGGWDYVGDVATEQDGTYDLGGLAEGTYRIEFDDWSEGFATLCFDGKPDLASATDVVVGAHTTVGGIDAALPAPGRIMGRVTAPNQSGLEDIAVVAYHRDNHGAWQDSAMAWTDRNGYYDLSAPRSGSYRLQFVDYAGVYGVQWYSNQSSLATATEVPATLGLVTSGINATLAPGGRITGVVRAPSRAGIPDVDVIAYQPDGLGGWIYVTDVGTDDDGTYELGGLATGTYHLEFDDFSGHGYASQFYDNQSSLGAGDDVAVTAGTVTANVNAILGVHGADTTAPTTVVAGAGAGWYKTGLVTLTASDDPGGTGMERTEYRVHGSKTWTLYVSPLVITNQGSSTYDYRSVDAAQNAEPVRSFTVNIDSSAPAASAAGPTDGAWVAGPTTIVLTGTDAPDGSGVASLTYALDGVTRTVDGASASVPLPATPNGTRTLTWVATDRAGNSSPEQRLTLYMDTTGPVTDAKAAGGTVGRAIVLRCRVRDNLSPRATGICIVVKNARHKVVKKLACGRRSTGTWFSVRWKPAAKGAYSYSVLASDLAGNRQSKAGSAKLTVRSSRGG